MEPWNRFATDAQEEPADFYRLVLTKVLDDLMDQVGGISQIEEVKIALRKISQMYKGGLSIASSQCRSDWSDPANRCAYVFLYLMQHCHLVFFSLQFTSRIFNSWRSRSNLKVCSIGGGPGSDLVGLTTFLRVHGIFPPSLECLVLDLYPNWEDTWDTIHQCIPQYFRVAYERCDVVRDMGLTGTTHRFIRQADMLTLVKFFSAVSVFFREDPGRGDFLRSILCEVKQGCFVLYIDNKHDSDTQFEREFASQVGLVKVFEFRGKPALPFGQYSSTVKSYCRALDYTPMRSCDVLIQLYEKLAVQSAGRQGTISQVHQTQIPPQHFSSSVIDRLQHGLHRRGNPDDRPNISSQHRYISFPAQRMLTTPSPSPNLGLYASQRRVPTSPVVYENNTFPQSEGFSRPSAPQQTCSYMRQVPISSYAPHVGYTSSYTSMQNGVIPRVKQGPQLFSPSGKITFPTSASYRPQPAGPCLPKTTKNPNSPFNQIPTSALYSRGIKMLMHPFRSNEDNCDDNSDSDNSEDIDSGNSNDAAEDNGFDADDRNDSNDDDSDGSFDANDDDDDGDDGDDDDDGDDSNVTNNSDHHDDDNDDAAYDSNNSCNGYDCGIYDDDEDGGDSDIANNSGDDDDGDDSNVASNSGDNDNDKNYGADDTYDSNNSCDGHDYGIYDDDDSDDSNVATNSEDDDDGDDGDVTNNSDNYDDDSDDDAYDSNNSCNGYDYGIYDNDDDDGNDSNVANNSGDYGDDNDDSDDSKYDNNSCDGFKYGIYDNDECDIDNSNNVGNHHDDNDSGDECDYGSNKSYDGYMTGMTAMTMTVTTVTMATTTMTATTATMATTTMTATTRGMNSTTYFPIVPMTKH